MKTILLVGAGGAIGSILRYLTSVLVQSYFTMVFPFGTFVVNMVGSLAIGVIFGLFEKTTWMGHDWRIFLAVGVCGGFTTFSSFANENVTLLRGGLYFQFALYAAASLFFGILLAYFGFRLVK
ncbi:MAG: fluoride efflux transporter CrcB [Bacteroidales bacterium]|nr:fluoride efflux transporter CrcB [Bacteroidales bacterium]